MPDQSRPLASSSSVPVWDVPTRLFHWSLVILIVAAFLTYQFGDINMTWHKWNGYAVLTLVLYRVMWGLFGSNTARFSHFVLSPKSVLLYLKTPRKVLGHNPLGAWMIVTLLLAIMTQGAMGLFTTDEILVEGPLTHLVASDWSNFAGTIHRLGFYVIVGFAGVHILAALFYWVVKKENLIAPMISGRKPQPLVPEGESLNAKPWFWAVFLLVLSGGLVWLGINIWTL